MWWQKCGHSSWIWLIQQIKFCTLHWTDYVGYVDFVDFLDYVDYVVFVNIIVYVN